MDRSNDIYQKVTDQIITELENGNVPWIRPWRDGEPPFPINALSPQIVWMSMDEKRPTRKDHKIKWLLKR
nr:ArdC family protein [Leclercia sp. J807]